MDTLFFILELIGTAAFSVAGALAAIRKRLDVFGVLVSSATTALGGGILRDVLLANLPPAMFRDYSYLITAAAVSLVTFLVAWLFKTRFSRRVPAIESVNNIADAVGLGIFTVVGINTALRAGYADNAFFVIFLGTVTGVGGGMLRDVTINEIPMIFTKRIYAVASLLGGLAYYLLSVTFALPSLLSVGAAILIVFLLRILASVFRWDLPKAY